MTTNTVHSFGAKVTNFTESDNAKRLGLGVGLVAAIGGAAVMSAKAPLATAVTIFSALGASYCATKIDKEKFAADTAKYKDLAAQHLAPKTKAEVAVESTEETVA